MTLNNAAVGLSLASVSLLFVIVNSKLIKCHTQAKYNRIRLQHDITSLQSSDAHVEARQSLESIGRAGEVSFQFRAKYSLGEVIADTRG